MASSNSDWKATYSSLKNYHENALKFKRQALALQVENKLTQSVEQYNNALEQIDKALELTIEMPSNPDSTFESACSIVRILKEIRKDILSEIADLQVQELIVSGSGTSSSSDPPSYEEAMSTSTSTTYSSVMSDSRTDGLALGAEANNNRPITYMELGNLLENLKLDLNAQSAQVILQCEGIKVYYISPGGHVTAALGPDTLRVFEIEDGRRDGVPKYYLQIGTFLYPLVANVSPCLRSEYGAIMLPNVNSISTGEVVGIIIPSEYEDSLMNLLEDILQTKLVSRMELTRISDKISGYIVSGANTISSYMMTGARKADQFLTDNTPKLIDRINPSTEKRVSSKVKNGMKVAKNVTATTATVTGLVASTVGAATMCLGRYLAPHIKKGGKKILTTTIGIDKDDASRKVEDIFTVTAGAIEGFAAIYEGLEQSAGVLGRSLATNTVQVVKHRYGEPVGEVTENTFSTVGNSIVTGNNLRVFRPNNIIRKTAKGAFQDDSDARLKKSPTVDEKKSPDFSKEPPIVVEKKSFKVSEEKEEKETSSAVTNGGLTNGNADSSDKNLKVESTNGYEESKKD